MKSKYLYILFIPLIVIAWFGTLVLAKEFISADDVNITTDDAENINYLVVTGDSGGLVTVNAIEFSFDQNDWFLLSESSGTYGVDTTVSARFYYHDLPSPGANDIYFRATDQNATTWPAGDLFMSLNRPNFLTVTVTAEPGQERIMLEASENNSGPEVVDALEYRIDGGSWVLAPDTFGGYGTDFVASPILWADYPCSTFTIEARAIDQNGLESPPYSYPSESFDGTDCGGGSDITVSADQQGSNVFVSATSNDANLDIQFLEYNLDGGGWIGIDTNVEPDGQSATGVVANIPPGAHTFNLRAIGSDDEYYPLSPYSINIPAGLIEIYREEFEQGIGEEIGAGNLSATIGSEWDLTLDYGRMRIQGGGFEYAGNAAATLDSVDGGDAVADLVLTQDLSNFQSATDLELNFQYMWHHSNPADGENNRVYVRASDTSDWIEVYNLHTNAVAGNYVGASIDLDEALDGAYPTNTFQVRFHLQAGGQAVSTSADGGFSIDNVSMAGTITGLAPDITPPEIEFTQSYNGIGGGKMTFIGTVSDPESLITNVHGNYTVGATTYSQKNASADDMFFDSNSEAFSIIFTAASNGDFTDGDDFEITITATNSENLTEDYVFTGIIDGIAPVIQSASTLGQNRIDMTVTPTLNYTGTASDADVNVANVQFRVYDEAEGFDTDWANATATDGAFDEPTEAFSFSINTVLPDGNKQVFVRTIDSVENILDGGSTPDDGQAIDRIVIDSIDTTAPDIELQQIIPDPTSDPEPPLQGKVKDDTDEKTSNIQTMYYRIDGGSWNILQPYDGSNNSTEEFFSLKLTGLALGSYTADVRAVDASGNDTNTQSKNQTVTFEIIEQDPDQNAVNIVKSETFDDHDDHDIVSSDLVWGNGVLRLKEAMAPTRTSLITSGLGPRYGSYDVRSRITPSAAGGFWVTKENGTFSYYNNGVETAFDAYSFAGYPVMLSPNAGRATGGIKEIYVNGEYHVWVAARVGLLGINFGASITDGYDSYVIHNGESYFDTYLVEIDTRTMPNYGVYFTHGAGIGYFRPGDFSNSGDDASVSYGFGLPFTCTTGSCSGIVPIPTALFFDQETNTAWFGDFQNGIYKMNDNGTPTNLGDDSVANLARSLVSDFVKDKNDKIVYTYPGGVEAIINDQNTFAFNDDQIQVLATYSNVNDYGTSMDYLPGQYPVGGQFFISTVSGRMIYLSINDTYTDRFDDQFLDLNINNDIYPAEIPDFYMTGYGTMRVLVARHGVYDYDLHREFASTGRASSEIDAQIEGRLDADFITLDDVEILLDAGGISYEVSNDGGITWFPIEIGETVNFPERDYRIKFRITMTEGSTPVIGSIDFSYSAYLDEEDRGFGLEIENEPETVLVGSTFSFDVNALDLLNNPVEGDQPVTVELRRLSDNQLVSDFNINNIVVNNGIATITNANANVLGTYYIRAFNSEGSATSNPINFIGTIDDDNISVIPLMVFRSNKYQVRAGEEFTLSWNTNHLNNVTLLSATTNYGAVTTNGSIKLSLDETTEFALEGTGPYGNLRSTLIIEVIEDSTPVELSDEDLQIEIVKFEAKKISENNARALYEVTWEVKNADTVNIKGIGEGLAPSGSAQIYVDEDTELELIATNSIDEERQTLTLEFTLPQDRVYLSSFVPLIVGSVLALAVGLFTISTAGGITLLGQELASRFGILYGLVIPRKRKYWGFVFDVNEYKPIPFAYISIYKDGALVDRAISDEEGKYGILLEKSGEFNLEARAQGFESFSKKIKVEKVGNNIEVIEDIPMVQINKKPSLLNKIRFYYKAELIKWVKYVLTALMFIGFVYSLYILKLYPNVINLLIIFAYLILFLINFVQIIIVKIQNKLGMVVDVETLTGLPGVSVRFYREAKQVGVYLTNSAGRMKIRLDKGKYWCLAHKEGYGMVTADNPKLDSKDIEVNDKGYISKDIVMKKVDIKKTSLAELIKIRTLENPFS